MISAAILYKWRIQSHYWDWLDALERTFDARLLDVRRDPPTDPIYDADVVILHHSVLAKPTDRLPLWARSALNMRRGKLLWFLTNEFRDFGARHALAVDMGVDWIATQLPLDVARIKYAGFPLIATPPALNDRAFRTTTPWKSREFDLGYRGMPYPGSDEMGDDLRNRIVARAYDLPRVGWRVDVKYGRDTFGYRPHWAAALNTWRATVSTESGMVGAKCIASRHLDAIGCGTVQIMQPGAFNGILKAGEHYVPVEMPEPTGSLDDLRPLDAALQRALDEGEAMAARTREYIFDTHTYRHRMAFLALMMDELKPIEAGVINYGPDRSADMTRY